MASFSGTERFKLRDFGLATTLAPDPLHPDSFVGTPVGNETLEKQVVACLLLSLCGNIEKLEDLRSLPDRLRRSRILDYMRLVALQRDLRPIEAPETDIEVLDSIPVTSTTSSVARVGCGSTSSGLPTTPGRRASISSSIGTC